MSEIAVELDSVTKFYKLYESPKDRLREALNPFGRIFHKPFFAVNDINLEVRHGEVLGVVGRNGSGKSTLLKLISGVLVPSKGRVKVNGKVSALLELGSGLNPEFTGIENVFFYGTILGFSRAEMESRLESIIQFADIGEFIYQPLKTYSSGMKSRLGFALAVSVSPDILIVDEVLAVGDLVFQRKCYNKIKELFSEGKTVIFVSHSSQAIAQFCNRVVLLENGRLVRDGEPKSVLTYYENSIFSKSNHNNGKSERDELKPEAAARLDNELYLENLKSRPALTNGHLAEIFEYRIIDARDMCVNLLDRNGLYTIEFKIRYLEKARQVSVGAQIRTLKNLLISGANQWDYQQEELDMVNTGDVLLVRWKFKCMLVAGVYVVALSSLSNQTGDQVKMNDALMFKVRPDKKVNGGVVCLDQNIRVEKISNGRSAKEDITHS